MSARPTSGSLMIYGVPFEPDFDDLDDLRECLGYMAPWDELEEIFEEALELLAFSRDELRANEVPHLPYFSELRALIRQAGAISQHRDRAALSGMKEPLAWAIRRVLGAWDCPLLKTLTDQGLQLSYALASAARTIEEMANNWPSHPAEEIERLEEVDGRLDDIKEILALPRITETSARSRCRTLQRSHYAQHGRPKPPASIGGSQTPKKYQWALHYLRGNLAKHAYYGNGKRKSRSALAEHLAGVVLPNELKRLKETQRELPTKEKLPNNAATPGLSALYGRGKGYPGWLIDLGYESLPKFRKQN